MPNGIQEQIEEITEDENKRRVAIAIAAGVGLFSIGILIISAIADDEKEDLALDLKINRTVYEVLAAEGLYTPDEDD